MKISRLFSMIVVTALVIGHEADGLRCQAVAGESTLAAEPETVSVATNGILYLYGHRMEPPFVFVLDRDTVWVNGVQFSPAIRPGVPPPPTDTTGTDTTGHHYLNVKVHREVERLLLADVPYDSVVSRVVEMYRGSDMMDSVVVDYRMGVATLKRYWKDTPWPWYFTVPKVVHPPPRPLSEFRRNTATSLAESLQGGAMLVWGEGQRLIVSRHNVTRVEDQIRRLKERGEPTGEDLRKFTEETVRELLDPMPLEGGERR
jgi:hypothetical protein